MLKLLIVEDEVLSIEYLISCVDWSKLGFEITDTLENGIDALDLLEAYPENKPDAVLTDIRMPGMDGLELAKRIKENYPEIEVVILTGFVEFEYAQRALKIGVGDFIIKPSDELEISQVFKGVAGKIEKKKHEVEFQENLLVRAFSDLTENYYDHDKIEKDLKEIIGDHKKYNILSIRIISSDELLEQGVQKKIMDAGKKIVTKFPYDFHFGLYRNDLFAVCSYKDHTNQMIVYDKLRRFCLTLQSYVKEDMNISIAIGIGMYTTDYAEFSTQCQRIFKKLENQLFIHESNKVYFEEELEMTGVKCQYPVNQIKEIVDSIKVNDTDIFRQRLDNFFQHIHHSKYNMNFVRNLYFDIYMMVRMSVFDKFDDYESNDKSSYDIINTIESIHTLEQLNKWMVKALTAIIELSGDQLYITDNKTVRNALRYLSKNYTKAITLFCVAENCDLNPVYLGRLIKRETGESFCDWILKLRIQSAKNLLQHCDYKIYEVATKVGYSDYRYFCQVFKKATGITPTEYKATNQ